MPDFSQLSADERKSHFCNLVAAAQKDGVLRGKERTGLARAAQKYGLTQSEAAAITAHPEAVQFIMPSTPDACFHQFYDLIEIMMVDGEMKKIENDICRGMAARLGFAPDAVEMFKTAIREGIGAGMPPEKIQAKLKRKRKGAQTL